MKRRTLLRAAGTAGVGLFAGCIADGTDGGGATDTDAESPTDSPTPSPSSTKITSQSFTVTNTECGSGQNTADGSLDGSTITVDGVIVGSDACYSAKLTGATVGGGTLEVAVASYVPSKNEGEACADCVVDIAYEATFEFEGSTPDRAVVAHDDEQVVEFQLG